MNKISMRCVSTYFQPTRKKNCATFVNKQPEKPPSQIDHVIVSSRWSSAIHNFSVKWGISIKAYGRKYDHGLSSGSIGSRITYVRLRGSACNILIVGVYIPQRSRKDPDQKEIYGQLESFLMRTGRRDFIILMGDFNSRLSRNIDHRVGKWSIHRIFNKEYSKCTNHGNGNFYTNNNIYFKRF